MYPNLMGQKSYFRLSNDDMGKIIGTSRQSYENKLKTGRFTPKECIVLCKWFNKSFEFLFAMESEVGQAGANTDQRTA